MGSQSLNRTRKATFPGRPACRQGNGRGGLQAPPPRPSHPLAAARAWFPAAVAAAGPWKRGPCVRQRSGIPPGTTPVVGSAATFRISGYPDCRYHQLGAATSQPGRGSSARSQEGKKSLLRREPARRRQRSWMLELTEICSLSRVRVLPRGGRAGKSVFSAVDT